jgi:hypothetical protein
VDVRRRVGADWRNPEVELQVRTPFHVTPLVLDPANARYVAEALELAVTMVRGEGLIGIRSRLRWIVWSIVAASIALLLVVGYVKERRSAREGPVAKLRTFGSFGDIAIGAVVDSRGRRFVSVTFPLVEDQSGMTLRPGHAHLRAGGRPRPDAARGGVTRAHGDARPLRVREEVPRAQTFAVSEARLFFLLFAGLLVLVALAWAWWRFFRGQLVGSVGARSQGNGRIRGARRRS